MQEEVRLIRHKVGNAERVGILVNGKPVADLPYQVARTVGKALIGLAQQIENDSNPLQTIEDQSILMRAGLNIGLSDNPKILDESWKEAQHNSKLRKYMKNIPEIKGRAIFGTPTIKMGNPNA